MKIKMFIRYMVVVLKLGEMRVIRYRDEIKNMKQNLSIRSVLSL